MAKMSKKKKYMAYILHVIVVELRCVRLSRERGNP